MKKLATISALICWLAVCMAGCSTVEGWMDDGIDSLEQRNAEERARIAGGPVVAPESPVTGQVGDTGADADLSGATWYGPNGAGAKVTGTIDNLTFDGTNFRYVQGGTSGWPFWDDNGKKLNSYACFFVVRDGKLAGGKFDACSPDRNWRDVKNIYGKYTGEIVPVVGEDVWFCLINKAATERTTAQKVVWK